MNIEKLTVSERIKLAEALWDSVANHEDEIELTENQIQVLEARLSNYQVDKHPGESWSLIKELILAKKWTIY